MSIGRSYSVFCIKQYKIVLICVYKERYFLPSGIL